MRRSFFSFVKTVEFVVIIYYNTSLRAAEQPQNKELG